MNIQSLMKQAQLMQKNIMEAKTKIESAKFEGNSELVCVKMNGKNKIENVKIKIDDTLDKEDLEILQDMIMIAVNDAVEKIKKEKNKMLGSQAGPFGDFL